MATLQELRAAIDHITACTGDKEAWRRALSPADLAAVSASVIDPAAGTELLVRIRANHPGLFDLRTGAPITPAHAGQDGVAADAMKVAEDALVRQNSRTAEIDLQVITAIAGAHSETEQGSVRLRELQMDIENAVRARVDLDTPAGARDFQRYLIGKLREIAAVVESAGLDSTSKAVLAGAWTALYRSSARPEPPPESDTEASSPAAPAVEPDTAPVNDMPPYGVDTFGGPADDSGLPAVQTFPTAGPSAPMPPAAGLPPALLPGAGGMPAFPTPVASPPLSGLPRLQPDPVSDHRFPEVLAPNPRVASDLDELLDALIPEPAEEFDGAGETDGFGGPAEEAAEVPPDPGAATRVPLPDGSTVSAPSVALAHIMRDTLAGTPIPEAFRAQGITVPPPGSSVGIPVEPARVVAGDVGMFVEHQALALDSQRVWLRGRVQPVGAVTDPSFLGWLHPPAPTATPINSASPTTAPAAAPGTAR